MMTTATTGGLDDLEADAMQDALHMIGDAIESATPDLAEFIAVELKELEDELFNKFPSIKRKIDSHTKPDGTTRCLADW